MARTSVFEHANNILADRICHLLHLLYGQLPTHSASDYNRTSLGFGICHILIIFILSALNGISELAICRLRVVGSLDGAANIDYIDSAYL